ncbi:MAG TPA: VOC family protein [Streptosporangiaceae bacterium]
MTHYSRLAVVVVDVPGDDHDKELDFWAAASGEKLRPIEKLPEYHSAQLHGLDFGLLIQRIGEGPARMHIDIHTDDLEAEVARLEALGAQRVEALHFWCVMRDPAGLLFCVVAEPAGELTDENAHRWD